MRVLLLGGYGRLGTALRRAGRGHEIVTPPRAEADLTREETLLDWAERVRPEVIINAAAYVRVDDAESHAGEALALNVEGAAHAAAAARAVGAGLLYISTDYVFPGDQQTPYRPEDEPRPLNVYGVSKLYGEFASATVPRHWIVRLAGLYGRPEPPRQPADFVEAILRLARSRDHLEVVTDQVTAPSNADDVAAGLWEFLAAEPPPGVYHLPQGGECSWFKFAQAIGELAGLAAEVRPTTAAALGRPAPRPAYSVLSGEKTWALGVRPLRHWREALAEYLTRMPS
jgi:dTDP-4-dehydrorhamnose reductase